MPFITIHLRDQLDRYNTIHPTKPLTTEELAARAHISHAYLLLIEGNHPGTYPSILVLASLCTQLKCKIGELVEIDTSAPQDHTRGALQALANTAKRTRPNQKTTAHTQKPKNNQ